MCIVYLLFDIRLFQLVTLTIHGIFNRIFKIEFLV